MGSTTFKSIKKCSSIFSEGDDVLVFEKKLVLFRKDGTFITRFMEIRYPYKVVFLPNRTALVDSDGGFHYISLEKGQILWSVKPKGGDRCKGQFRFAVSPDRSAVYDVCSSSNFSILVDRFFPERRFHDTVRIKDCLRSTRDIFCDQDGTLCALQRHIIINHDEDDYENRKPSMIQWGIQAISYTEDGTPKTSWKKLWQTEAAKSVSAEGCDGRYVLMEDFTVLDLENQTTFRLLPEETCHTLPQKDGYGWTYDEARKLLTVYYIGTNQNVIIDCQKRELVAQYYRENLEVGFEGCLIENEFWTGTSNGIVKKPFPSIEPPIILPPPWKAHVAETSKFYAEHPELW